MDLHKLWGQLEPNLLLIYKDFNKYCTRDLYMKLYSLIYSYLTISFRKQRLLLFEDFYKKLLSFIDSLNSQILNDITNDNFIKIWKTNFMISQIVNNIFDYFNRTYISKLSTFGKSDFHYIDSFINSWNTIIMNNRWYSILENILLDINLFRKSKNNTISYIIDYSNYLIEIDFLNKDYLYSYLVKPVINDLNNYYTRISLETFNSTNVITYIDFVNKSFKNELELSKKFFHNFSNKIYENCYMILIHDKLDKILLNIEDILKNPNSLNIINYMYSYESKYIQTDQLTEWHNSYKFDSSETCHIRSLQLDDSVILQDSIINYIKITNIEFFTKTDSTYNEYITYILELHAKYSNLFKLYLGNNNYITDKFDKLLKQLINKNVSISDNLNKYYDHLIKNNELDAIDNSIFIINYLDDYDIFIKYYQKYLAKRLLSNSNLENEQNIINQIKDICGFDYSNRLIKMISDIKLSNDITLEYNQFNKSNTSFNIITSGIWPLVSINSNLISVINDDIKKFTDLYDSKYNGRKLKWCDKLSRAEVSTIFLKKKYSFTVSTYQLGILLLFNSYDTLTIKLISEYLNIDIEILTDPANILVKSKLLILENEEYKINYNYKSKNLKKNLNITLKVDKVKENKKIVEESETDMNFILQSIIIKIMKTRKELDHDILVNECITNIGNRFKIKLSIIKKCIEILIDKEYLSRCENNNNRYKYIS